MCDTVPQLLNSGEALVVHSVFHHACNLATPGNQLLTLLTQDTPLAPGAVRMACADFRPRFLVGEMMRPQGDGVLVAASCRVRLTDVPGQSTRVPRDARFPESLLAELNVLLPVIAPEYGIWNTLHGNDERLVQVVRHLAAWLGGASPVSDDSVKTLIGAGAGLTPSGDDFLLGMLFVLKVMRHRCFDDVAVTMAGLLDRTTDISRAMLRYGCRGHFGEQLLALTTPTSVSLNQRLLRVAEYGHSSGHDMLTGLFFTLRALSGQRL
jgi:hypothetical protein